MKLSVVMPVFNENATIRTIVDRVLATPYDVELVIVDDFSTDGTREKLPENTVDAMRKAFDEKGLLNPGKAIPTLHRCAELGAMHVHHGKLPHPELPRF